jgi:hypothetical protein
MSKMIKKGALSSLDHEHPGSAGKLDPLEFLEPWRIPGCCAFRSGLPSRRTV